MNSRDTELSMAAAKPQVPDSSSKFIISESASTTAQCSPTVLPVDPNWCLEPYLVLCDSSYLAPFIVPDDVDGGPYHHEVNQMYEWALHNHDGRFTAPSSVAMACPVYNPDYPSGCRQPAGYENNPALSTHGYTWQRMERFEPPTAIEVPRPPLGYLQMDEGASEYKSMNGIMQGHLSTDPGSWHTNLPTAISYAANHYSETPHQTSSDNTTSAGDVQFHAVTDPRQDALTAAELLPPFQAEATDCLGPVNKARSPVPQRMPAKRKKRMISCSICREEFHRPCNLRRHMYQHEGQHECLTCGKRFHEKYQLSNHAKSHAGPFACTLCPKTFEKRSSLRSHLPSHEGFRRLLPCPFTGCGKQYRRGGCLNRHIKSAHQVGEDYSCQHCGRSFRRSDLRDRHEIENCPLRQHPKKKTASRNASSMAVQTQALAQASGFQSIAYTSSATPIPSGPVQAIYETASMPPMSDNLSRAVKDITRILPNGTILPQDFLYGLGTLGVDSTSHTASTEMAMSGSMDAAEQIATSFSTPYPYLGTEITFKRWAEDVWALE